MKLVETILEPFPGARFVHLAANRIAANRLTEQQRERAELAYPLVIAQLRAPSGRPQNDALDQRAKRRTSVVQVAPVTEPDTPETAWMRGDDWWSPQCQ